MTIQVGEEYYRLYSSFNEVDNKRFALLVDFSESLNKEEVKAFTDQDFDLHPLRLFEIMAKVVELLSDVPEEVLKHVIFADLTAIFAIVEPIFLASLGFKTYETEGQTDWLINDKVYSLPKSDYDLAGNEMPLYEMTGGAFCQCSDIMASSYQFAGAAIGLMMLKDEKDIKEFAKVPYPMSLVFECYEKINKAHAYIKTLYPNIYKKGKGKKSAFGWDGLVMWSGGGDKPLYDFMKELAFKLEQNERD